MFGKDIRMSEITTNEKIVAPPLVGRLNIYSNTPLDEQNIIVELSKVLASHLVNVIAIEYLYWYRRGLQPILGKVKDVRPEINHIVVENHADEIVGFKNGYFLTQPAFYISRSKDEGITEKVKDLNEYLYLSGKNEVDNKVVDWFHTTGTGILYVTPVANEEIPVKVYALDPRSAFVVYDLSPAHEPLYGVNIVMQNNKEAVLDVYTRDKKYTVKGGFLGKMISNGEPMEVTPVSVEKIEPNPLGYIPMVEYHYNSVNMGAFESVIPLLDAINEAMSDRVDGIDQFIQSLAIAINCDFDEGVTANTIRQAGMIAIKSVGDNKADFKILSEQLDQGQTQVLVDYLYQQVLTICGMPSTTKGGTSTSDTGAAVLYRDGWYQADTFARNTEDLFKEANRRFDEIFISILNRKKGLGLRLRDFELQFVRNETANLLVKTQGALNLKQLGLSPEITLAKSGVSNDPVADVANSKPYIEAAWNTKPTEVVDENINETSERTL